MTQYSDLDLERPETIDHGGSSSIRTLLPGIIHSKLHSPAIQYCIFLRVPWFHRQFQLGDFPAKLCTVFSIQLSRNCLQLS